MQLDAAGIRPSEGAKRLQREAWRAWLVGLAFSALGGGYTLFRLREAEKRIDRSDGEGVVEAKKIELYVVSAMDVRGQLWLTSIGSERQATNLQLVSDLCDMTMPTSSLGLINFDDGIVGLSCTVSSLIGVWAQWRKTA